MRTGVRTAKIESTHDSSGNFDSDSSRFLRIERMIAMGELVGNVVHELSNPLTSIIGNAQRLLARQTNSENTAAAKQILFEAERTIAILSPLLSNVREPEFELKSLSLNQVVLQALESKRERFSSAGIRLRMELDPSLPLIRGDAGRLRQVILNLLRNARQSMEGTETAGEITVRTKQAPPGSVALEIEDSGPGIPLQNLPRLFQPFFTTKPPGEGTGLGLAIASSIMREHNGEIRASNSSSGGAVFKLILPALRETSANLQGNESRSPGEEARRADPKINDVVPGGETFSATNLRAMRVLVVEDEPTVAGLIGEVLGEEGAAADLALNGCAALEKANHSPYDLVICDIKLPDLDGREIFRQLTAAGRVTPDKFLFVTDDIVTPGTRKFLEENRLEYLPKPFRLEELIQKISNVWHSRKPALQSHQDSTPRSLPNKSLKAKAAKKR
jgi:CheY-like chemotaxis protein